MSLRSCVHGRRQPVEGVLGPLRASGTRGGSGMGLQGVLRVVCRRRGGRRAPRLRVPPGASHANGAQRMRKTLFRGPGLCCANSVCSVTVSSCGVASCAPLMLLRGDIYAASNHRMSLSSFMAESVFKFPIVTPSAGWEPARSRALPCM